MLTVRARIQAAPCMLLILANFSVCKLSYRSTKVEKMDVAGPGA